jgi:hypothetical protein
MTAYSAIPSQHEAVVDHNSQSPKQQSHHQRQQHHSLARVGRQEQDVVDISCQTLARDLTSNPVDILSRSRAISYVQDVPRGHKELRYKGGECTARNFGIWGVRWPVNCPMSTTLGGEAKIGRRT